MVDAVVNLVCDNSIKATLTFYYYGPTIAHLKAQFPRTPMAVKLRVDVKFLGILEVKRTFNLKRG